MERQTDKIQTGYNPNLIETTLRMIGDKNTIRDIVKLVAYIRHAVKNNLKTKLTVKIGETVANTEFAFDVNGFEVQDYIIQDSTTIN